MPSEAENMGRVSRRMRAAFAVSTLIFVGVLAISPARDYFQPWKRYKRQYARFAETRPDTKHLLADYQPGMEQIWIPDMNVIDRCTTCHQGMTEPSLADASVPQPFRAHPPIPHRVKEWGCVVCHRGQGPATEVAEAHETTLGWEQPMLPMRYIQASCGVCHQANLIEAPRAAKGRELLAEFNCVGCHKLSRIETPKMIGPDLTNVGAKVSREWIYKWLKEPRTIVDDSGNTVVNGYENEGEPRMPYFRLTEQELRGLSAYLASLRPQPIQPYAFNPKVVAGLEKKPDLADEGEVRFRQMFCSTCHSLAVTRAGQTQLIGGDIGPELTKVGSKVNPEWLTAWLRNPQAYLPNSKMPRYEWSDEDLYKVAHYITAKLTDPDLLTGVPKLGAPSQDEIRQGRQLFLEKGCRSCHVIQGSPPQKDFGPDLTALGGKSLSQLEFGESKIPRNLVSYIQAKVTDPHSVNPAARMPQYRFTPEDLDAITTALLSMTGPTPSAGLARLVIPAAPSEFHPAGEFGAVYERYKCYVCHRFNGFGGDLAPDLSYEGSRAQRAWLVDFLKNPQTLRPTLTFRMPQFNMTDAEANTLADYIEIALQSQNVAAISDRRDSSRRSESDATGSSRRSESDATDSSRRSQIDATDSSRRSESDATDSSRRSESDATDSSRRSQIDATAAARGKQLFEVKYQCQSCHTIGASGGYVGPNLNNVGNWMKPAWIETWLENPQALVPGTIEPRRAFTADEVKALTAYLITLRQSGTAKKAAGAAASLVGPNGARQSGAAGGAQ